MMHLFHSGRKFCLASAVYDMYFRSKAQRSPGCIHGNVSAAYYRDLLACHDRCIIRIIEGLHQIAPGQVFIGRKYAVGCLARDSHKHRKACAGADKYGFEVFLLHQLVDGSGFSDHYIRLKLNAQFFYFLDLFFNDLFLWKTELRNSVYQNAAKFMKCFEYGHFIAQFCQVSGAGKAGWARTDDCHFMSVGLLCLLWLDIMLQGIVRNEPF